MSPDQYTPQPQHISPPSSITPTRHNSQTIPDYTSPSAYFNHDAYIHTQPNTPHGTTSLSDAYDLSSSHDAEAEFGLTYGSYNGTYGIEEEGDFLPVDHTTPSASRLEDDRTPVVSETQSHIPASSFPAPPNLQHTDNGTAAFHQLMSPFRPFENQPMTAYPQHIPGQHYIDPSQAYYAPSTLPLPPHFAHPSEHHYIPQYVNMPPHMGVGHVYTGQPMQYIPVQQVPMVAGPVRSRQSSPTSSITSSAVSLARSASTSSELKTTRPKVKLTYDDKRNIVELQRSNSSLRQEDIARQYG